MCGNLPIQLRVELTNHASTKVWWLVAGGGVKIVVSDVGTRRWNYAR